jgi:regulator of replication initiation timing
MKSKNSKKTINPNACNCGKSDCILTDKPTYSVYYKLTYMEYLAHGFDSPETKISVGKNHTMYSQKMRIINDPFALTKCNMAKEYMRVCMYNDSLHEENLKLMRACENTAIAYDKTIDPTKKIFNALIDVAKECKQLKDKEEWFESVANTKIYENRALRKEIRDLKQLLWNVIPKGEQQDESKDEPQEEPKDEPQEDEGDEGDEIPELIISPEKPEGRIFRIYESLKRYMTLNKCSIAQIAKRNSSTKAKTETICEAFINLRQKRVILAHPKGDKIKNDFEFIELLESV